MDCSPASNELCVVAKVICKFTALLSVAYTLVASIHTQNLSNFCSEENGLGGEKKTKHI